MKCGPPIWRPGSPELWWYGIFHWSKVFALYAIGKDIYKNKLTSRMQEQKYAYARVCTRKKNNNIIIKEHFRPPIEVSHSLFHHRINILHPLWIICYASLAHACRVLQHEMGMSCGQRIVINFAEGIFRFCRIFLNFCVFFAFFRHANNFRCCYALLLVLWHSWRTLLINDRQGPAPDIYEQVGPCLPESPKRLGGPYIANDMGLGGPHITGVPISRLHRYSVSVSTVYTTSCLRPSVVCIPKRPLLRCNI